MARKSSDWNEGLAKDLRDPEFAQEFIQASLDEGIQIQEILGKVIRSYGVKEFAKRVKISSPNLLRAVNPKHNPTMNTLNRILAPFSLRLVVGPLVGKQAA